MDLLEILTAIIASKHGTAVAEQLEHTFKDTEVFEDQNDSALECILNTLGDIELYVVFSYDAIEDIEEYQNCLVEYLGK